MNSTPTMKMAWLGAALGMACALAVPAWAHGTQSHPAAATAFEQTDWGIGAPPLHATRTIRIDMTDAMRFSPDRITVREGETVRFVVRNRGRMLHEMVIGTPAELAKHAALMAKFPDMEHDAPYMAHVAPGKSGEIVWQFNRAGDFEFACLIAGHYEAGMRGTLRVQPVTGEKP
ncbi:MAG: cupredoxin family protein [Thiobacillus sp.]|nr:cupredoxin family protein [Thiobacillus sp.]